MQSPSSSSAEGAGRRDSRVLLCCAWLLVALTVLAFLAVPIWSQLDRASKPLPPVPENPAAIIFNFQKIAFAAGDLRTGEGIVC